MNNNNSINYKLYRSRNYTTILPRARCSNRRSIRTLASTTWATASVVPDGQRRIPTDFATRRNAVADAVFPAFASAPIAAAAPTASFEITATTTPRPRRRASFNRFGAEFTEIAFKVTPPPWRRCPILLLPHPRPLLTTPLPPPQRMKEVAASRERGKPTKSTRSSNTSKRKMINRKCPLLRNWDVLSK